MDRFTVTLWRIGGIPLILHWSWFVFMFVVAAISPKMGFQYMALFGLIVLHEYGHAVAAIRRGFGCQSILLFPLGGMARLDYKGKPFRPLDELIVTLAGPAVNFVLFLAAIPFAVADTAGLEGEHLADKGVAFQFLFYNLILFVFNMLPAFPMDGGRLVRATMSLMGQTHLQSTTVAVYASRVMVFLFFLTAMTTINPGLLFAAMFVFLASEAELMVVRLKQKREDFREDLATVLGDQEVLDCDAEKLIYHVSRIENAANRLEMTKRLLRLWPETMFPEDDKDTDEQKA